MNKTAQLIIFGTIFLLTLKMGATSTPLEFRSIRQLGMGGVGLTTSRGEDAIFSNPAALSLSSFRIKLPRVAMHFNQSIFDFIEDLDAVSNNLSAEQDRYDLLKQKIPFHDAAKLYADPFSIVFPNFGGALKSNMQFNVSVEDKISPKLQLDGTIDSIGAIGFSRKLSVMNQSTMFGVSAKYVNRYIVYNTDTKIPGIYKNYATFLENINNKTFDIDFYQLSGFLLDFGMIREINTNNTLIGYWGVSIKNINMGLMQDNRYRKFNNKKYDSFEIPIYVGIGLDLSLSTLFTNPVVTFLLNQTTVAVDYDLIYPNRSVKKRLKLGVEKKLFSILGSSVRLRGGLNAGYIVGGFGISFVPILYLDYAYYMETFNSSTQSIEQPFHAIQVGVLF